MKPWDEPPVDSEDPGPRDGHFGDEASFLAAPPESEDPGPEDEPWDVEEDR